MKVDLKDIVFVDTSGLACVNGFDPCSNKERTLSYALYVDIPQPEESPEAIFKECCYTHIVLASTNDSDIYKNDFSGFFHKRQISSETADFVLIDLSNSTEYNLDNSDYGVYKDFGDITANTDLKTFVLDWRKVLLDLGAGAYKVVKRQSIVGLSIDKDYLVYNLNEFSTSIADKTFRMDVTISGLFEKLNIDFSGSDFKTSLRVGGFFGRGDFAFEEDILVDRNYIKNQISIKKTNQYKMQTDLVPECITDEIVDFLLFSDDIKMNDYNLNNHSYNYKRFPVKYDNNEGTGYFSESRKAILNLVFNDKIVNNNKRNY